MFPFSSKTFISSASFQYFQAQRHSIRHFCFSIHHFDSSIHNFRFSIHHFLVPNKKTRLPIKGNRVNQYRLGVIVAVASLSHRKHLLLLSLRLHYAFAQKTFVAVTTFVLRFRTDKQCVRRLYLHSVGVYHQRNEDKLFILLNPFQHGQHLQYALRNARSLPL